MPGIRKGLKVMWLPAPAPMAAPTCPLLVEVMMAAPSAPPGLLSAALPSSWLLPFSPASEPEDTTLSAAVVEEGLAASGVDAAVVVVTLSVGSEEEDEEEEEVVVGREEEGGGVCAIMAPTLNMAC